jgi:hypothetical protein
MTARIAEQATGLSLRGRNVRGGALALDRSRARRPTST